MKIKLKRMEYYLLSKDESKNYFDSVEDLELLEDDNNVSYLFVNRNSSTIQSCIIGKNTRPENVDEWTYNDFDDCKDVVEIIEPKKEIDYKELLKNKIIMLIKKRIINMYKKETSFYYSFYKGLIILIWQSEYTDECFIDISGLEQHIEIDEKTYFELIDERKHLKVEEILYKLDS